jgi:hypothetical protein
MTRMLSPWLAAMAFLFAGAVHADDSTASGAPGDQSGEPSTASADQPAEAGPADEEAQLAAEQQQIIEQIQKEHAAEQNSVAAIRENAEYQQAHAIKAPTGAGQILAFHPLADGGLVIATGANEQYGEQSLAGAVASLFGIGGSKPQQPPANQLIWLDAAGEPRHTMPLPFASKGVTVAPDGGVIAVGDDRVVIFSQAGEQMAEAEAPHFNLTEEELAELREEIAEQQREQTEARRQGYETIVASRAELEKVPEEERTPRQKRELAQANAMARSFEAMLARAEASADDAVAMGLANARTIHRVAASRDHLFLVAREPAGQGFGVWRCGRDFASPEKIIDGLRGCCGQMDVQVIGDDLVIAENARHHVAVYGLDGEPRRTFGEGSRTDIRKGFGGCCNPMNACPGPDGTLLLSESNGLVKQFASDGTLVEILGAANVQPGCKNSSIGFSTDGSRLYYLDVQKGEVLVMEKRT